MPKKQAKTCMKSGMLVHDSAASNSNDVTASTTNPLAEALASRLETSPHYLTSDGASWYLWVRNWWPCSTAEQFAQEWEFHPAQKKTLVLFGREAQENRWSQCYSANLKSFAYSGTTHEALPLDQGGDMNKALLARINQLCKDLLVDEKHDKEKCEDDDAGGPYNMILQNWYEPDHTIGQHTDDEKMHHKQLPIFSLSQGGTRRFLFRDKKTKEKTELYLQDGDLLVMGGTCQQTHKHEVPKRRATMDPPTSNRINWTIRAFQNGNTSTAGNKRKRKSYEADREKG